jgi:hypothetical protein
MWFTGNTVIIVVLVISGYISSHDRATFDGKDENVSKDLDAATLMPHGCQVRI